MSRGRVRFLDVAGGCIPSKVQPPPVTTFEEQFMPEDQQLFDFDGETYEPKHDRVRLNRQLSKVWAVMLDQKWRTLKEISHLTDQPEASISARLRDLRKERFGSHRVERERYGFEGSGTFIYRLLPTTLDVETTGDG